MVKKKESEIANTKPLSQQVEADEKNVIIHFHLLSRRWYKMATQRVWLMNKFLRITREFPIRDASLLLADEFPT